MYIYIFICICRKATHLPLLHPNMVENRMDKGFQTGCDPKFQPLCSTSLHPFWALPQPILKFSSPTTAREGEGNIKMNGPNLVSAPPETYLAIVTSGGIRLDAVVAYAYDMKDNGWFLTTGGSYPIHAVEGVHQGDYFGLVQPSGCVYHDGAEYESVATFKAYIKKVAR